MGRYTNPASCLQCLCVMSTGKVVCRLTESTHRISGITILDNKLYLLRVRDSDQIEIYDVVCPSPRFTLQRCLSLPRLYRDDWNDMTSSGKHLCLYVSNFSMNRIQRVDPDDGSVTLWPMPDPPCGLSMTRDDNLLVTFQETRKPGKVLEIDGSGKCIRKVVFEEGVLWMWHAIEVRSSVPAQGQYVICHGYYDQHDHCVSLVGSDDGRKFRSYGGIPGADANQLYVPYHLAVDPDGFVFVADHHNRRVVVLSAQLDFVSCVASRDNELKSQPRRLCYDVKSRLLYVGQDDGTLIALSF